MAEYDLPAGPAELFAAVRETLGEHLGGQRSPSAPAERSADEDDSDDVPF